MFTDAKLEQRGFGKFNLYGPSGVGKTVVALEAASVNYSGKIAVIDTEDGTLQYGRHFDFVRARVSKFNDVVKAILQLKEKPGNTKVLILDSASVPYVHTVDAYTKFITTKEGNRAAKTDYMNGVNKVMNRFYLDLISLPFHVISIDRETDDMVSGEFAGSYKKVGVKPENYSKAKFMFDYAIRIDADRVGHIEKQRDLNKLPTTIKAGDLVKVIANVMASFPSDKEIPSTETMTTIPNHFSDRANVEEFINYYKINNELSADEIVKALGVKKFSQFEGTAVEATELVEKYLADNVK